MIIDEKTTTELEKLVKFELQTYMKTTKEPHSSELWQHCKEQIDGFMMDEAMATTGHTSSDLYFYRNLLARYEKVGELLGFDAKKELKKTAIKAILATINDLSINYDITEPCLGPFDSPFLFLPLLIKFFEIELYQQEEVVLAIKKACTIFLEDNKNNIFIDLIDKTGLSVTEDNDIVEKIKDNIRETISSYGEGQSDFSPEIIESLIKIGGIDPATLTIPVAHFLAACHEVDDWIIRMARVLYPAK